MNCVHALRIPWFEPSHNLITTIELRPVRNLLLAFTGGACSFAPPPEPVGCANQSELVAILAANLVLPCHRFLPYDQITLTYNYYTTLLLMWQ